MIALPGQFDTYRARRDYRQFRWFRNAFLLLAVCAIVLLILNLSHHARFWVVVASLTFVVDVVLARVQQQRMDRLRPLL